MSTPFHKLPAAYIPIVTRVQNTYWPAKDRNDTTCSVSLKDLTLPANIEVVAFRVAKFLGVQVTYTRATCSLQLSWGPSTSFVPPK